MTALKFICLSDTHGIAPPRVDESDAVAWLHAGDFSNFGLEGAWKASAPKLIAWSKTRTKPMLAVQGNHDCGEASELLAQCATDISGRVVEVAPHVFVAGIGVSGGSYCDTPGERRLSIVCDEVLRQFDALTSAEDLCILLTHYPAKFGDPFPRPKHHDEVTYECVKSVVETITPLVVIQGHAHYLFGIHARFGHSLVINPGSHGGMLTVNCEAKTVEFKDGLS